MSMVVFQKNFIYRNRPMARFHSGAVVCWSKGTLQSPRFWSSLSSTWRIFRCHGKNVYMNAGMHSSFPPYIHSATLVLSCSMPAMVPEAATVFYVCMYTLCIALDKARSLFSLWKAVKECMPTQRLEEEKFFGDQCWAHSRFCMKDFRNGAIMQENSWMDHILSMRS